jgi:hypothetical protein
MTSAAFDSLANPINRTATAREIAGAESSTTSANAALRSRTSAHHAPCVASFGRTTVRFPIPAQSRGASVRDASMYATHSSRCAVVATMGRSSESLPVAPTISLRRPRGSPPDASALSSTSSPVGSPGAVGRGAGSNALSDSTRSRELTTED